MTNERYLILKSKQLGPEEGTKKERNSRYEVVQDLTLK